MSELEGFIGIRAFISSETRFGRENSESACQVNKWIDIGCMLIHQQNFSFSASVFQTYTAILMRNSLVNLRQLQLYS